jgi:hypothetical protein
LLFVGGSQNWILLRWSEIQAATLFLVTLIFCFVQPPSELIAFDHLLPETMLSQMQQIKVRNTEDAWKWSLSLSVLQVLISAVLLLLSIPVTVFSMIKIKHIEKKRLSCIKPLVNCCRFVAALSV